MNSTILLVDDEGNVRASLSRLLRKDGHHILEASSGAHALEILQENDVQLIISDMRMPGMDGAEFLGTVASTYHHIRRIILTGYASIERAIAAINEGGVNRYLTKPWENEHLREVVLDEIKAGREVALAHRKATDLRESVIALQKKLDLSAGILSGTSELVQTAQYDTLLKAYQTLAQFQMPEKVGLINEVEHLASKLGKKAGLSPNSRKDLSLAVLLHRFGELALPVEITKKCFLEMEPWEWETYRHYPEISVSFIEQNHKTLSSIIASHRRIDGSRTNEDFPLEAKITLVCTEYIELLRFKGNDSTSIEKIRSFFRNNSNQRYPADAIELLFAVLDTDQ